MKLKSPSAASRKSTLRLRFFTRWLGHSSGDFHLPRLAIAFALLFPLTACQQARQQSQTPFEELRAKQTIHLEIQTPNPAWSLEVSAVYETDTDLICVSELSRSEGMFAQVISNAEATFTINEPTSTRPIRHYVLGKTWNWDGNPEVTFIDSLDEIKDALADAQSVPFTTP